MLHLILIKHLKLKINDGNCGESFYLSIHMCLSSSFSFSCISGLTALHLLSTSLRCFYSESRPSTLYTHFIPIDFHTAPLDNCLSSGANSAGPRSGEGCPIYFLSLSPRAIVSRQQPSSASLDDLQLTFPPLQTIPSSATLCFLSAKYL